MAHGEDTAAGDDGRCTHRHADGLPPLHGTGLRVQCEHVAEARGRKQPAPRQREAAAEGALVIVFGPGVGSPQSGTGGRVEGRNQAPRIHGEDPPAGDDGR